MEIRFAVLYATLLVSMLAAVAADVATDMAPNSRGAEGGFTRIQCAPDNGIYMRRSRGAIIDTGTVEKSFEVILTAAHGMPSDVDVIKQNCRVVGAKDRQYRIEEVWRPDSQGRDFVDDWAVLLTERSLSGHVKRLRTLAIDHAARQQLAANQIPVRLPLRFVGIEQACGLTQRRSSGENLELELFGHTCRAWSGHSGSPILIAVESELFILGIHLGNRWIIGNYSPLEIGRYVDVKILEAIHAATAQGRGSNRVE